MATAYPLPSTTTTTIFPCPIDLDLSFDLDEAIIMNRITNTSAAPDGKIKDADANSELIFSNLPTVATGGVCSVCMEDFQPAFPGKQVLCGHVFHATCIATWISLCDSCPLCRSHCVISGHERPEIH